MFSLSTPPLHSFSFFFFFNDTAPTEIHTLPPPDALPILARQLVAAPLVAAHEVRAHGLVVLEWHEPVRTVARGRRVGQVRELSMPDGVRDLHRQLVRELAPAVLGKALPRDAPCLIAVLADDDPNSHARTDALVRSDLLLGRFRVLDGYRANRLRRRQPRVRRARHEDSRKQLRRQWRCKFSILYRVISTLLRDGQGGRSEIPDDSRVLPIRR